jgi:TRAP-type mannitol/chloroaromatic compound transport system permease small subunit
MSKAEKICAYVDSFSEWTGRGVGWLVLILTLIIGYDVALRYLFNAPTKWAYELSYQLGGTYFWLGAAYTLRHRAHVRIDIFYGRFSPRLQALVDAILYLVLFFPVWGGLTYYLVPYVVHSWQIGEKAMMGFWQPIIYPFKTTMIVGTIFLLLQGTAEFIRSCVILLGGKKGT